MDEKSIGFNSEVSLMESFSLSLHYTKKWFKEVHLITDLKGEGLVKRYGLEFDHINNDLEKVLKNTKNHYWSLGKIYACKIQDKPFIHIDNDAFLFKRLPNSFLSADAGFQHLEASLVAKDSGWYDGFLKHADSKYKDKPIWFDTKTREAYNCGLIAFNKLDILEEWWEESLKYINFLEKNIFDWKESTPCIIFEQSNILYLTRHYNYKVDLLTNYGSPDQSKLDYIPDDLAEKLGYTHLVGEAKRSPEFEEGIRKKLLMEGINIKNHFFI